MEADGSLMENEIEKEDISVEEKEIEHKLDQSLPIINFASCMNDELIEFMLDFFDLTDEDELLQFCVIYFAAVAAETVAWAGETA